VARTRKPGRITIGSRAVAVAILAECLEQAAEEVIGDRNEPTMNQLADKLVGMAWDVEYKPTAERLVVILDAGITSSDKMRSTPEDEFHPLSDEDRCPYISNGKRCLLPRDHIGDHDLED
jgi:hypothetical protein